jgi:hypothetical protein
VRDDPYPYPPPRPFIRSRNDDEDPDTEEYEPPLMLELYDSSERRGFGSGGIFGTLVREDDDGPPREECDMFVIDRCERTEEVGAARVRAGVGEGKPREG